MARTSVSKLRVERFKRNLRSLIADFQLTQKKLAEQLSSKLSITPSVAYNWVRKSCNDGIARRHPRNERYLQALCEHFGISHIDSLWGSHFRAENKWSEDDLADEHREFVADFNWLLSEHSDDHNVAEVRRVITEAVEQIRRPTSPKQTATDHRQLEKPVQAKMPRAVRFKTNLRHLIEASSLTQKEFAERLNLPYDWMRKACTHGVAQTHSRNEQYVQSICDYFGLRSTRSLWEARLAAKTLRSSDQRAEEERTLRADLVWLLKEYGDDREPVVRSRIAEVKRVIGTVMRHLFDSKDEPPPVAEIRKPKSMESKEEASRNMDDVFARQSKLTGRIRIKDVASTPTRDVRATEVDHKRHVFETDTVDLDDQIDRDMQKKLAGSHHDGSERNLDKSSMFIKSDDREEELLLAVVDSLPQSVTAMCETELLKSMIPKLIDEGMSIKDIRLMVQRSLGTHRFQEAVSEVKRLNEVRSSVANPEAVQKRKRIRRRRMSSHGKKKSSVDAKTKKS